MKIDQTDGYCDNEPCLSKELKSIKMNAGRCAHAIVILLTFPCLLSAFPSLVFVAALQFTDPPRHVR